MIYETTDIKLGAVLLCEVPGAYIDGLDERIINSKRVVRIEYPAHHAQVVQKIADNYARKLQAVNVFKYNRALCDMRDILRGNIENGHRMQAKEMGNGTF